MRKALLYAVILLTSFSQCLMAEPLVLEQAGNVLDPKTLEIGVDNFAYQTDEAKLVNSAGSTVDTLTYTAFIVPIFARYAFTPHIEASISVPYNSVIRGSQLTGAAASTTASDSGLTDPVISGKYSTMYGEWNVSGYASLSIAAGVHSIVLPQDFGQGSNIQPGIAARKDLGPFILNANLSYDIAGQYVDANNIKRNPASVLYLGIGAEKMYKGVSWCAELIYNSLSTASSSTNGVSQSVSSGTQTDLVLGGRYNKGNIKTKLGLDLSLGDEQYRVYDYRIIAGITFLVGHKKSDKLIKYYY